MTANETGIRSFKDIDIVARDAISYVFPENGELEEWCPDEFIEKVSEEILKTLKDGTFNRYVTPVAVVLQVFRTFEIK